MEKEQVQLNLESAKLDLDTPTSFLGLTLRQIHDWEARHRQFCKTVLRQACSCAAWD